MKPATLKILFVFFFLIGIIIQGCYSFSQIPQPPEKISSIEEFETYLQKLVDYGTPPGLSFLVVKNGEIVYNKGFGWADRPKQIKASPESVYHWWSITKIITAIAILQLREEGRLSLDDKVIECLPYFNVNYPSDTCKTITILNLLNHSSGLPDLGIDLMFMIHHDGNPPVNQTALLKNILPRYSTLLFDPGGQRQYSNLGYIVLGAIIEKVTGQSYEDYVRQNILMPLKMEHTDFVYTKAMLNEASGSHTARDAIAPLLFYLNGSYIREIEDNSLWFNRVYTDQTPSTAIIGPVMDAARLMMAYLNEGELNGQRILSEKSVNFMSTEGYIKVNKNDPQSTVMQGIGWLVYNDSGKILIKHDGGGPGFSTSMQLHPEENLGFVLFTNDVKCECWRIINLARKLRWE